MTPLAATEAPALHKADVAVLWVQQNEIVIHLAIDLDAPRAIEGRIREESDFVIVMRIHKDSIRRFQKMFLKTRI
jgi:hypothetical protein